MPRQKLQLKTVQKYCKRIASFDIGTANLAYYVEDFFLDDIEKLREEYMKLPRKDRRRVKGVMNKGIKKILNKMFVKCKGVSSGVTDIRSDEAMSTTFLDLDTRRNLFSFLEKLRPLWDLCSTFLIEQQFFSTFVFRKGKSRKQKGGEGNIKAIKVGEDLLAWFLIHYPDREIVVFGSTFKTQILGAPDNLTKYQRKKWSVQKALEIFDLRKEGSLGTQKKKDDVADACIQCQAYKFRTFIGKF